MKKQRPSYFNRYVKPVVIIGLILVLSSCATMRKEECLTADWYQVGYEDGSKGFLTSRIAKHRKACLKYDITPDLEAYLNGRARGLEEYCTPYNGYQLGVWGLPYMNQCRGEMEDLFLNAYNRGKDIYYFKQQISKEEKSLKKMKHRLSELNEEITGKEQALSQECSDQNRCKQILDHIRVLDGEKNRLVYDITRTEEQISHMEQTLADMQNQNRF